MGQDGEEAKTKMEERDVTGWWESKVAGETNLRPNSFRTEGLYGETRYNFYRISLYEFNVVYMSLFTNRYMKTVR